MKENVIIFPENEDLAIAAAELFLSAGQAAILHRGRFMVALSGGTTPRYFFQRMVVPRFQDALNWEQVHLFWGDERCVPPDHPDSNYGMARKYLIEHLPIPPANVHRMKGEASPEDAARIYEEELRSVFALNKDNPAPRFDLAMLGMGNDGHTASLFPGTAVLEEKERWVAAQYVEKLSAWRLTLTPVILNAAREVLFMVSGNDKAKVLARVLFCLDGSIEYPAQLIKPTSNRLHWFVEERAADVLLAKSNDQRWQDCS